MTLPRHAEIWLPAYLRDMVSRRSFSREHHAVKRVWLAIADHFEPFWKGADENTAEDRVAQWCRKWPELAARYRDSRGQLPKCTFFYAEEQYRPSLLDSLAKLSNHAVADVEVHIHHDREGQQNFVDRVGAFTERLFYRHGLLRKQTGKIAFGFIHGNWALDNSLPGGRWCGLNNEITLLQDLGCYADFTMPSGASPTQARTINQIYWAIDDPGSPKSYDRGIRLVPGGPRLGLLMIPGPFGLRWKALPPRMETGEVASYDLPNPYRVRRWLDIAPRLGPDVFVKLHTHGAQERHTRALLSGGYQTLFSTVVEECRRRDWQLCFVSCHEMFQVIESIRTASELCPHSETKQAGMLQTQGAAK
jgi:hypothetical protein